MDIEVRRNLVHRPITGTCRADAVALCLSRPPPAPPSSRAYLRPLDGETPPPRRFAARPGVVHRRTTDTLPADLTDAMARCDRLPARRHPVHTLSVEVRTASPRGVAGSGDHHPRQPRGGDIAETGPSPAVDAPAARGPHAAPLMCIVPRYSASRWSEPADSIARLRTPFGRGRHRTGGELGRRGSFRAYQHHERSDA